MAISNVEVFELRGEFEYASIELGIYGWEPEERDLPAAERAVIGRERLAKLLQHIAAAAGQFVFQVWLDEA